MEELRGRLCTAFAGDRCVGFGQLEIVALLTKAAFDRGEQPVLLFDNQTSDQIEIDFRGTSVEVLQSLASRAELSIYSKKIAGGDTSAVPRATSSTPAEAIDLAGGKGPGRPRLGVVAREVTLLPRHWEWLSAQPGGASVAIRKLVESARRSHSGKELVRQSQDSTYKFVSAMAGDRAGFEEATRALFAGDQERFCQEIESWPIDIQEHAKRLSAAAFAAE